MAIKALGGKRPSRETSNREATVVGVQWCWGCRRARIGSAREGASWVFGAGLWIIGGGGLGAAGYRSASLQDSAGGNGGKRIYRGRSHVQTSLFALSAASSGKIQKIAH